VKLTMQQVIDVHNGLAALDGRIKFVGEVKEVVPFKFSGTLLRLIGRWRAATKAEVQGYNETYNALVSRYALSSDGTPYKNADNQIAVPQHNLDEFNIENRKLLAQSITISLNPIKVEELKLDDNKIPGTALGDIDPILVDADTPAKPADAPADD